MLQKLTRMIDLPTVAERLGCDPARLRRLINRGEGPPYVMLGRDMMFRESSVEAWLAKRERESQKAAKQNLLLVQKFTGTPKESARAVLLLAAGGRNVK